MVYQECRNKRFFVCLSVKNSPDIRQYVIFDENGTIDVKTNCNGMSGYYALKGDSLDINGLSWTELSCDDMTVEEMLRQLLPKVCVCKIENDSILLLNTAISGERIVLRKATERK